MIKMDKIKRGTYILILFSIIILTASIVSAGVFQDFFDKLKITGKTLTQDVSINITVTSGSAPEIQQVYNITSSIIDGPNEGPSSTQITINFTVYDADEFGNLNDSSAQVNVTATGETNRTNASCAWVADYDIYYANYTCNITMWWFDGAGTWTIHTSIKDDQSNVGTNNTKTFTIGTTDGVANNQSSLSWSPISPGETNQPANEVVGLNNTGNMNQWIRVNATDLVGESNPAHALGASNFSVNGTGWCQNGTMVHNTYVNITDASLPKGNYTINNGTAQEILYFCLEECNSDLEAQSYSTGGANSYGPWIIALTNQ